MIEITNEDQELLASTFRLSERGLALSLRMLDGVKLLLPDVTQEEIAEFVRVLQVQAGEIKAVRKKFPEFFGNEEEE